jgi:heme iron utilization protein
MKDEIKAVLARAKMGTLSVIDFETGGPFGALVNVATNEVSSHPLFLFSTLARHTKCLAADPRASLMIAELPNEGDPLVGFRATITGHTEKVSGGHLRAQYLSKHPYAETYIDFGDFSFWTLKPEKVFVVGGFGRIQAFDASHIFGAIS